MPEVSAVRDADRIIGLMEAAQIYNIKLILNRLRPDMVKTGDMLSPDDVREILACEIIGIVPDDEKVVTSTNRGEPASADKASIAGEAFRAIAARIMGETVPLNEYTAKRGFFGKLFGKKR